MDLPQQQKPKPKTWGQLEEEMEEEEEILEIGGEVVLDLEGKSFHFFPSSFSVQS